VAGLWIAQSPQSAQACGLTPPIGPNGLPAICRDTGPTTRFRAGVTLGGTSTQIEFGPGDARLLQGSAAATLDFFPFERLGLSASLGASLPGRLDFLGQRYHLSPGPLAGVGASYRLLGGKLPFVHLSFTYSLAQSTARAPDGGESSLKSYDYRAGLAVGATVGKLAAPFVFGRYFGAGTRWEGVGKGADAYRYHLGTGTVLALSQQLDLLGELAFLGEKRASLGVGYVF
jgi:hypothetical protein